MNTFSFFLNAFFNLIYCEFNLDFSNIVCRSFCSCGKGLRQFIITSLTFSSFILTRNSDCRYRVRHGVYVRVGPHMTSAFQGFFLCFQSSILRNLTTTSCFELRFDFCLNPFPFLFSNIDAFWRICSKRAISPFVTMFSTLFNYCTFM